MSDSGEFVRDTRYLDGRITADGRDGTFPAQAGRYRLVVARACPWANRSMIVPAGPDLSGWISPHHREELGGRPFGDGTPPGPPPPGERVAAAGPGR